MVTTNTLRRAIVSLNIPRKVADLLVYANNIAQKLNGNPNFPSPLPTIVAILAAITDLHTSETAVLSRTKGAATVRNDKRAVLVALLQQLRGYVQAVADATPENGAAIIESAGFAVRKTVARGKRQFAAQQGALSGSVVVTAVTAGARASYDWEYSVDGGKTWIAAPSTTQGRATITGIAAATAAQFRYRTVTPKGGQGDWTQPTTLIVK